MLGPIDDASVLDLYAGSGALGLEALSRGARRCVFADTDRGACRVIAENAERLGATGALVLQRDALSVLREEARVGRTHDLILIDPPYEQWSDLEQPLGELLPTVLAPSGLVVVETSERVAPQLPLDLTRSRRYGSARLGLFRLP